MNSEIRLIWNPSMDAFSAFCLNVFRTVSACEIIESAFFTSFSSNTSLKNYKKCNNYIIFNYLRIQ